MALPLRWELPGGKCEPGESPAAGLRREIREELAIGIAVDRALPPVRHASGRGAILLRPFLCRHLEGALVLREHRAMRWLGPWALPCLDWAEADRPVISRYLRGRRGAAVRGRASAPIAPQPIAVGSSSDRRRLTPAARSSRPSARIP
jgi:8-oxo-dGTP diphosphatase